MLLSFVLTVVAFIFLVRWAPPKHRFVMFVVGALAACVWLGVPKGLVATAIAFAFTSGYVATRLDARRIGKRIAIALGTPPNLFFSALEQVLPMYLNVLAQLEREGRGVSHATSILLPQFLSGLDALEARFGRQPAIDDARQRARQYESTLSSAP